MFCKRNALLVALVAVCLIVQAESASAHDYFNDWAGHWVRGTPGSTWQKWDFDSGPGPNATNTNNPYAPPTATFQGATWGWEAVVGPDGNEIDTWHIDQDGGSVDIFIANSRDPNELKLIYLQVTSDKAPMGPPGVAPPPWSITSPGPIVQHPFGTWYTYNWLIEIRPNPWQENIKLEFYESTDISQIVVDTICVPEPSGLLALVGGLVPLGFALYRKVRK